MFKKVGASLYISCDYKSSRLRVGTDEPLIPGYRGFFREIADFRTREEWSKSVFAPQIVDEEVLLEIDWFWIDMLPPSVNP